MTKFIFLAVVSAFLAVGFPVRAAGVDQTSGARMHHSSHKMGQLAKHHKHGKRHKKHHQAA